MTNGSKYSNNSSTTVTHQNYTNQTMNDPKTLKIPLQNINSISSVYHHKIIAAMPPNAQYKPGETTSFLEYMEFPKRGEEQETPNKGKLSSPRTNNQGKPQRGKTRRNNREGISRDRKSQRQSERAPNGISSEAPAGKFQRRSERAQKGSNSEAPAKAKRNPREGISFDFHSQVRSERAPKGNKFLGA